MTAAPVRFAGHPRKPLFAHFGYLSVGGAFGAELTATPAGIAITQVPGEPCTGRLMYS